MLDGGESETYCEHIWSGYLSSMLNMVVSRIGLLPHSSSYVQRTFFSFLGDSPFAKISKQFPFDSVAFPSEMGYIQCGIKIASFHNAYRLS